ncbi:MAG: 50S ribosomal protein L19 [Candidatus Sungbacteria bacterium RIFCSPHIGHO2_02_FULL_49_20]|uniref:Large ribosomal subunit protein bL19 n=1 Tax=Candidatus Sungbacteria bacterium RIFCSPHIGHO2_02_FULL_49_20 TaxID=1802272 RepID=A0A1G2KQE9_9BACT|nr:MAG: 50S ribosomal protein L19 [Candidatus Sungbacteria bacterium RIFCSPHIGHO2_02_FULL_49_20]
MSMTTIEKNTLRTDIPQIKSGDFVRVIQKVKEGDKERLSPFEGLVIAVKHGTGPTATFTVRKVVSGIGVERVFPMHSPVISKIEVLRHSKVRRAKLYYIREKAAKETRKRMKSYLAEAVPQSAESKKEEG